MSSIEFGSIPTSIPGITDTLGDLGASVSVVQSAAQTTYNIDSVISNARSSLAISNAKTNEENTAKNETRGQSTDYHKRLRTIRSRSAKHLYNRSGAYTSDRGPITYMRLLKSPDYDINKLKVQYSSNHIDSDVDALLSKSGFTNFFVTGVNVTYAEKTQVMTTFGDNEIIYYFGKQPIAFNITGLLFDSLEDDWFSKFLTLYSSVLRGSQLAKNFGLVELTFPNMVLTGTISQLSTQQDSQRDTDIGFTMQFLAKEVVPLPMQITPSAVENVKTDFISFSADRSGVNSYSLASSTLGGGFMDTAVQNFNKYSGAVTSAVDGVKDMFSGITGGLGDAASGVADTLNSFRTNIFSPIFGVISGITKIVKSATGSISSIISSFTNPVNQILRDITSFATKAGSLALLVEHSINDIVSIPNRTVTNVRNTIASLKNASGTITRVPENISDTFRRFNGGGNIPNRSAILSSGRAGTKSKAAVLSSGNPYTPRSSGILK